MSYIIAIVFCGYRFVTANCKFQENTIFMVRLTFLLFEMILSVYVALIVSHDPFFLLLPHTLNVILHAFIWSTYILIRI